MIDIRIQCTTTGLAEFEQALLYRREAENISSNLFLASDDSSFITGIELFVDGVERKSELSSMMTFQFDVSIRPAYQNVFLIMNADLICLYENRIPLL